MIGISTLLASLLPGTAAPPAAPPPTMVYRCSAHRNLGTTRTTLQLEKTFNEDGSVREISVNWSDNAGEAVRRQGRFDQAMINLHFPGGPHDNGPAPIDWSTGTVAIHYFVQNGGEIGQPMQDERWQQVIVDRDGLLSVRSRDGQPFLEVGAYQVGLMGETRDLASPRGLTMSLDSLLAWGAGRETVRVYQVLLSFQAPQPHVYSPQPWRRRIVAQYELDVGAIARTVGQIRETVAAWEAEVADFRQVCRHEPRSDDENIVVT